MKVVLQKGGERVEVGLEEREGKLVATLSGVEREVDVLEGDQGLVSLLMDGCSYACDFDRRKIAGVEKVRVYVGQSVFEVEPLDERLARRAIASSAAGAGGAQVVVAPMPGKVVRLLVKAGQAVKAGDGLVVVEAMKMENELRAAKDGVVKELLVAENVAVEAGAKLVVVE
jgi:biotin carboxyl carrier protein